MTYSLIMRYRPALLAATGRLQVDRIVPESTDFEAIHERGGEPNLLVKRPRTAAGHDRRNTYKPS